MENSGLPDDYPNERKLLRRLLFELFGREHVNVERLKNSYEAPKGSAPARRRMLRGPFDHKNVEIALLLGCPHPVRAEDAHDKRTVAHPDTVADSCNVVIAQHELT